MEGEPETVHRFDNRSNPEKRVTVSLLGWKGTAIQVLVQLYR